MTAEEAWGERLTALTVDQRRLLLARLRAARKPQSPSTIVEQLGAHPQRQPLFFVHGFGGSASGLWPLGQRVSEQRPFCGLQAPSVVIAGAAPYDRIADLAGRYCEEVVAAQPEGPYLLGGWCFGGLVAYQMALRLKAEGYRVETVLLLGSEIPNGSTVHFCGGPEALLEMLSEHLRLQLSDPMLADLSLDTLQRLPDEKELLIHAFAVLKAAGYVPETAGPELFTAYFNTYCAHSRALADFCPSAYDGEVTLLRPQALETSGDLGWRAVAPHLRIVDVPGTRTTVLREPHLDVLADETLRLLQRFA